MSVDPEGPLTWKHFRSMHRPLAKTPWSCYWALWSHSLLELVYTLLEMQVG